MKKYALIFCIVLLSAVSLYLWLSRPRIAYINNISVYNGFTLKKELESKLNNIKISKENILDSMRVNLQHLSKNLNTPAMQREFEIQREQYLRKKGQFDEENDALASEYTGQIWTQLNQYIKDYAQKHNYDLILGTTSDGSLMYARESMDLSADMIIYINKKYEGK